MTPSDAIRRLFLQYPDVLVGFADIAYSPFARQYPSAIVFAEWLFAKVSKGAK